jgi:phosphatidylinositol alpha-1,6-mannosyltransferase
LEIRPNALLVTRNFPPLTGGMERLTYQTYRALREHFRVRLCGPAGAGRFAHPEDAVAESPLSPLPLFLLSLQLQAFRAALASRPKFVHAGSGLAAPAALVAGRAAGAQVSCFVHGLDLVAEHGLYQRVFLPAIRRCDRIFVNSRHTFLLARQREIAEEKLVVLNPGVSLPPMQGRPRAREMFRKQHGLGDAPLLLSVGRLTARKGLAEFIERALPGIIQAVPNTILVVIGGEPAGALKHTRGVLADITGAIASSHMEGHVRLLGRVDDTTLEAAYFAADAHVFPILDLPGDVEGFGMVALEAAAHGLPTIAFAVGGVPDAVRDGTTGSLVQAGDYDTLTEATIQALRLPYNQSQIQRCHDHAADFAWPRFEERFLKLLQNLP